MNVQQIKAHISHLKHLPFGSTCLTGSSPAGVFELILMTADCANNTHLMALLGTWRKNNEYWFPATFPYSLERTTSWFANIVVPDPFRIIFLIQAQGQWIGHVGLNHFNDRGGCEIDSILRGPKKIPGIMESALKRLMQWAVVTFDQSVFFLDTALENERGMNLYQKLGFKTIQTRPRKRVAYAEGKKWVDASEPELVNLAPEDRRHACRMMYLFPQTPQDT